MRTLRLLFVMMTLVMFSSDLQAEETYHLVGVWPEAPQGWHFYQLFGIAMDKSGNVYVGDSGNYRIKKFDSEGRFITQWGSPGQGDGQFSEIHGVRVGSSGTVYVVDEDHKDGQTDTSRIHKFTPYGQFIGLFKRTAPDVNRAELSIDVTEDDRGNIYILAVDYVKKEGRIRRAAVEKYSRDGKFIAQWGMDAGSGDGQLQIPTAIDVDGKGNFYIVELVNSRVQKFDPSGKFLMKWETLGEKEDRFRGPYSIAIDKSGDVYIRDRNGVHRFTPEGVFLTTWEMKGDPRGLALDSNSNAYVTNRRSHSILKLDNTGKVIAQWGSAGTEVSRFLQPSGIVADPSGQILVANVGSLDIQRFTSEGRFVSKWGGWTDSEAWKLATDASGNVYAACGDANEVQKFDPDGRLICRWGSSGGGDGQFRCISAVALSPSDEVYATDTFNNRVQKFTSNGEFLAKWGTKGGGDGQFDGPFFIATDSSANVWVADQLGNGTHRMQKFDANGKFLAKWMRPIMRPHGTNYLGAVAVDSAGSSYYAFESRIEKYDAEGNPVGNYGQKEFPKDQLGQVSTMCVDQASCLYVAGPADPNAISLSVSGSIRKFDADGKFVTKWTAENTDEKTFPNGPIAVDRAGNMYTMSWGSPSIQKLSPNGRLMAEAQLAAPREGRFSNLGGIAVDDSGKVYAVNSVDVDWEWSIPSIQEFDPNGQFITMWEVPAAAKDKLKYPVQIAVDGLGNMYITDQNTHCVHKLDAQGKYLKSWGEKGTADGQFDTPEGIAVDASNHIYVCDRQNSRIQKFDTDGNFLAKWGKEGSGDGEFHFPAAVAIDGKGNVFVADSDNHRVQKFTADGRFLVKWGEFGEAPGQFNVPLGIAVDKEGNVYVSDSHNHRIQKFAPARLH
ncbi:MAG TPA: hypothetical protein PKH24_17020 [Sedimentisphaerales bacterium]|jgi:DNA-binding beta-propeller fold protein YncE|nr:hypothetical protein [Sedimentisphaerales bacterium]HNU31637.1 hypothetical protein [Sedimentisphaerales bacterium]